MKQKPVRMKPTRAWAVVRLRDGAVFTLDMTRQRAVDIRDTLDRNLYRIVGVHVDEAPLKRKAR